MTACIVGWSHLPFGKHGGRSAESLIVEAATGAIADAGLEPARSTRSGSATSTAASSPRTSPAPWSSRPTRPCASSPRPGRERLRHRLGGRAPGPARDRGQGGAHRPRRRRREDDRTSRPGHRRDAAALRLCRRGEGHRGRLRRRVRPDRGQLLPAPRRPVRRAGRHRRQEPQDGCANPWPSCARTWATRSAGTSRTRTRSSPARSSAPTARWSPTARPLSFWPTSRRHCG